MLGGGGGCRFCGNQITGQEDNKCLVKLGLLSTVAAKIASRPLPCPGLTFFLQDQNCAV